MADAVDYSGLREGASSVRVLVLGAGVIGSVYAGRLLEAGHEVVLMARGERLAALHADGLVLQDAESGRRTELSAAAVSEPGPDDRFELVLVPVRAEQLESTLPALSAMTDGSDVLFFGNTAGRQARLVDALGERALFGFPAAGGTRDGSVIRYVLITQQKTMMGEPNGTTTPRVQRLQGVFDGAGFPTLVSANIDGWLVGHAAFVVPIAFALYRVGVDAPRLAGDGATMRLMVRATRQAFNALRSVAEIPTNLRILYSLPTAFVTAYWRRVLASPRGELWFGAHSRAAREEMHALAQQLQQAVRSTGRATPDLDQLLSTTT
jgi:2-dehydropantoate 2-reductase